MNPLMKQIEDIFGAARAKRLETCQFIKRNGKCGEPATHETENGLVVCEAHWRWCDAKATP